MIKQNNSPALRFPEFQGEWEGKKLGEVGDVKMCRRIFNEETLPEGEIPLLPIPFGQVDFVISLNGCGEVSTACCISR
jgi:hypothetical protein